VGADIYCSLSQLKGTLYLGYGYRHDAGTLQAYPETSYVLVPANAPHFDGSHKDTFIIGTAIGPWTTHYVDAIVKPLPAPANKGLVMTPFILETSRLIIRAFEPDDLHTIHRILERTFGDGSKIADEEALNERREWLEWSRLSAEWLPKMFQPPYGDRAAVLKSSNEVIGAVGLVPCFDVFEQIPGLKRDGPPSAYRVAEMGLFWAIDPDHQRQGYANEAAQALIDFAFQQLRVKRLIATTEYDNAASIGVMRKLGMTIAKNPFSDPPWLQVVGMLEHPAGKESEHG
jgi:[ribosomal protein S5]-alanine N-acetyltransferase